MSIASITSKRLIVSTLALGSVLSVACTQSANPQQSQESREKTGETKEALNDSGCVIAGTVDGTTANPVPWRTCYNVGIDSHSTLYAVPNRNSSDIAYCPDQAVYELHASGWPTGAMVYPEITLGAGALQPTSDLCKDYSVHISVMVQDKGSSQFRTVGSASAPMYMGSNTCTVGTWSGWGSSGSEYPSIDPSQYDGVRVVGEIYWNLPSKGLSYSVDSKLTLKANCIW
jgi:hypothetical protein